MPLIHPKRTNQIANTVANSNGDLHRAGLYPVDEKGNVRGGISEGMFLLNPSTIEEHKIVNWNMQAVPGQSAPVPQFGSGGARTITFEALVTKDTSEDLEKILALETASLNVVSVVSSIASSLFNVQVPSPKISAFNPNSDKLSIENYLNYYRSLCYPLYNNRDNPTELAASPPLLYLFVGRSITSKKTTENGHVSANKDLWVLTDLRINITKQTPNLAPMEAKVGFTLVQFNSVSFDRRRFHNWT